MNPTSETGVSKQNGDAPRKTKLEDRRAVAGPAGRPSRRSSPGVGGGGLFLMRFDRRRFDQSQVDVIEAFDQTLLAERVDLELDDAAVGAPDLLRGQVYRQRRVGAALGVVHELGEGLRAKP